MVHDSPMCLYQTHRSHYIQWQEGMFQPLFLTSPGKIRLNLNFWETRVWLELSCECLLNHSILLPFKNKAGLFTESIQSVVGPKSFTWIGCPALRSLEPLTSCFELTKSLLPMMGTIIGCLGTLIFNEASFFILGRDRSGMWLTVCYQISQNKGESYEWQEFP